MASSTRLLAEKLLSDKKMIKTIKNLYHHHLNLTKKANSWHSLLIV